MPLLAQTLLPAWIAGLLISGAVAAMMSTADSQLLVSTSAISEDLKLNKVIKTKKSNKLTNTDTSQSFLGYSLMQPLCIPKFQEIQFLELLVLHGAD